MEFCPAWRMILVNDLKFCRHIYIYHRVTAFVSNVTDSFDPDMMLLLELVFSVAPT